MSPYENHSDYVLYTLTISNTYLQRTSLLNIQKVYHNILKWKHVLIYKYNNFINSNHFETTNIYVNDDIMHKMM